MSVVDVSVWNEGKLISSVSRGAWMQTFTANAACGVFAERLQSFVIMFKVTWLPVSQWRPLHIAPLFLFDIIFPWHTDEFEHWPPNPVWALQTFLEIFLNWHDYLCTSVCTSKNHCALHHSSKKEKKKKKKLVALSWANDTKHQIIFILARRKC